MTVEQLPSGYQFGKVVGRVVHAVADSPEDLDAYPEAQPAKGTITFTPLEKQRKVTLPGESVIVMHESVTCSLSSTGRVIDSEGRVGVWLIQGAWTVAFDLDGGSVDSFDINVTEDHTDLAPLDLVVAVPYVPPTGVSVINMLVPSSGQAGQVLTLIDPISREVQWTGTAPDLSGLVQTTDPRLSDARTPTAHDHDDRYYTQVEVDTLLSGVSGGGGVTLAQVNNAIATHSVDPAPHPAYDDIQDLTALFENGLA